MNIGILDLDGAHCSSCVYTIEHAGRKLKGVNDLMVDVNRKEIRVEYEGGRDVLNKVSDIVARLGYNAQVREAP